MNGTYVIQGVLILSMIWNVFVQRRANKIGDHTRVVSSKLDMIVLVIFFCYVDSLSK